MAPVNPPIQPTNDPTYGQNSRAIDIAAGITPQGVETNRIMPEGQKIGDRSAEYLGQAEAFKSAGKASELKGYGDLFAHITAGADFIAKGGVTLVKKDIENRVYEVANRERESYTAELEKIKAGIGVNNILDANARSDENGEPIPDAVSELPDTLATLKGARDAGKITKTDYQGRLLAEAKLLRAQYPNFKNEIDQEFAKVTGQNPANARINGLITEINRAAAANSSQQNKMLTFIRQAVKDGVPRAEELYQRYSTGQATDMEVISHIGKYNQVKENLTLRQAVNNDVKMTREEGYVKGKQDADYGVGVVVAAAADRLAGKLGITTPAEVEKLDAMQKQGAIPKQKWEQLNLEVNQEITRLKVEMLRDMDRTGTTKKLKGGKAEALEIVEKSLDPLYSMQKSIIDKNFGTLYSASRDAQSMLDDTKRNLLADSKAGPSWRGLATIKELGGEQYVQSMALKQALGKNGPPETYSEWFRNWSTELEAQHGATVDGQTRTFNDLVSEMRTKKIDDPVVQARIMKGIVTKVEKIGQSDVPDAVKVNIAKAAFSDGNNRFLSKLNIDSFDERGRPISGMSSVYQKWTSPEVTTEMRRLSKKDPALWNQYTNWVKESFGTDIVPQEINELKKIQKDPNIRIDWDTENKRFNVTKTAIPALQAQQRQSLGGEGTNTAEQVANIRQFQTVERAINRINSGLYNMRHVAAADNPKDISGVDAFMLKAVLEAAGPDVVKNINSIPGDMINKILLGTAYANRK